MTSEYLDRLYSHKRRKGWGGEGSGAVTATDCNAAIAFVCRVMAESSVPSDPPRTSPSVYGGVSLYWRQGDRHLVVRVSARRWHIHQEEPGRRIADRDVDELEALASVRRFHS